MLKSVCPDPVCVSKRCTFRVCRSLPLHKHCEKQSCAGRIDGHFRTVGLSLKFHPSAFVVHSEGREDKQVHMYKEIIPGLWDRRRPSIVPKLSGDFGIQDLRPLWTLSFGHFSSLTEGIFSVFLQNSRKTHEENHAGTVSASLLGCVSDAVWIPWRRLRGNGPDELQRHQKLTRCFGCQRRGHCQSESADLTLR